MKTASNAWRAIRAWLQTLGPTPAARTERGQTTAEYALVLLGVAAVALALTTWASGGKIGTFLDAIFNRLLSSAT
jgi:hypothetical protein